MRKRLLYAFLSLVIATACISHRVEKRPIESVEKKAAHEFRRGLWVRASSTAAPESIRRIVQMAERMDITDIFVQVVVGGYAYCKSKLVPRSQYLTEISGADYDPIDSLVSHFANTPVRVHAWINALLCWSLPEPPESSGHIFYTHPEWFIRDVNQVSMIDYGYIQWKNLHLEGLYLDPENPEVRIFVEKICAEIAARYPIDGIHLDFIRYPGIIWGLPNNDRAAVLAGIDAGLVSWCSLVRYGKLDFIQRWQVWHAWRMTRDRQWTIARIISDVGQAVDALRKDCRLSAAVFANPSLFRYSFAQNWPDWSEDDFSPVVMSYTSDIALFNDYMNFVFFHRPDALMGIGLLWPGMKAVAKRQVDAVLDANGAGVCYFDFANIDTIADWYTWEHSNFQPESMQVDSTRYDAVPNVFSDLPPAAIVEGGRSFTSWGNDPSFAAFLMSLSLNPTRDLARIGLDRGQFLDLISQDVAAFEYLNEEIFPIGDLFIEPPQRRIRYTLIPWSDADSLAAIEKADSVVELENDTVLYPSAGDPLTNAAFNAQLHSRETLLAPAGIYVFKVDSIYSEGRTVSRENVSPRLVPVFVNWTIMDKAKAILNSLD